MKWLQQTSISYFESSGEEKIAPQDEQNFLRFIDQEYGFLSVKLFKMLMKVNRKITYSETKRKFVVELRKCGSLPKHSVNVERSLKHFNFNSYTGKS